MIKKGIVVKSVEGLDSDAEWWHPVKVEIYKGLKRVPVNYLYEAPYRDINDGWLFNIAAHQEEKGKELGKILAEMLGKPDYYKVVFESDILKIVYQIRSQDYYGPEVIIRTMKLEGTGLQKYLVCVDGLDRIASRLEIEGKSQTIFDFFQKQNRPELVYSGGIN